MKALDMVYEDKDIVVVNKPSGLLSIPGRGIEKLDSVTTRLKEIYPDCTEQPAVHRLDMDTSGLMVLAFEAAGHRNLLIQFPKTGRFISDILLCWMGCWMLIQGVWNCRLG